MLTWYYDNILTTPYEADAVSVSFPLYNISPATHRAIAVKTPSWLPSKNLL